MPSKAEIKSIIKELRTSFYLLNKNILVRIALIMLMFLILLAVFAPFITPFPDHAGTANNPSMALQPMSSTHWFGTDEMGRDILTRVIFGIRISLYSSFTTIIVAVLIGSVLGAIAGASKGWVDEILMRITDCFLSFPPLLLAITIAALLGPSLTNAQIAIVLAWWPFYTRLMRGQAISVKEKQFVRAAEAIGTGRLTIIFRHIVPNCIPPIIVQASIDMGSVILTLASLGFLGIGAQAPTPEWGLMVSTSRFYFLNAQWYSIFPGLAIFFTVLSFNLIGDGLREVLDPKTRKN